MNTLSPEQKEKIEELFTDVWNNEIYEKVLTIDQKSSLSSMRSISFEIEEILERLAARFGLGGLSEN